MSDTMQPQKFVLPIRDSGGNVQMIAFNGIALKNPYQITSGGKIVNYTLYREGKQQQFLVYKSVKSANDKGPWTSQFYLRDTVEQLRDVVPQNVLDAWYGVNSQSRLF